MGRAGDLELARLVLDFLLKSNLFLSPVLWMQNGPVLILFYFLFCFMCCCFQVLIFIHCGHRLDPPNLESVREGLQNQILGLGCSILAAKNGGRKPGRARKFSQIITNDPETGMSITVSLLLGKQA